MMHLVCVIIQYYYVESFGINSYFNNRQYDKTFGKDWNPFSYDKRLQDSAKVLRKKTELAKTNNAESTKRQKLTSYISTALKSRQEEVPLVKH